MDANLHDFKNLKITGIEDHLGDIAFDEEPCAVEETVTQSVQWI
jgi:tRNA 2-thiocytidine biosynthesis protein TtcA